MKPLLKEKCIRIVEGKQKSKKWKYNTVIRNAKKIPFLTAGFEPSRQIRTRRTDHSKPEERNETVKELQRSSSIEKTARMLFKKTKQTRIKALKSSL